MFLPRRKRGGYKALSPEENPEFVTVLKVVKALGLRFRAGSTNEKSGSEVASA